MNKLDTHADYYLGETQDIQERFTTKATIELMLPYCKNKSVLTLGLGNGKLIEAISKTCKTQHVIEGSQGIIDKFWKNFKNSTVECNFFEKVSTQQKFDVILANHVLEHVDDAKNLLRNTLSKLMNKQTKLLITVPNAKSLHRQIGVEMGLLNSIFDLNPSDYAAGHQRVYDINSLFEDIKAGGLNISKHGGYNLKLVSLAQMKEWDNDLLEAIFQVSKSQTTDICANLWVLATKS